MSDDLVKRLRDDADYFGGRSLDRGNPTEGLTANNLNEAADRIEELESRLAGETLAADSLFPKYRQAKSDLLKARREALEEAARLCEEFAAMSRSTTDRDIGRQQRIAHAIRALMEKE